MLSFTISPPPTRAPFKRLHTSTSQHAFSRTSAYASMQSFRVLQFLALGYANFGIRGFRANQANFCADALDVDLRGRHYIVTGATSGLGRVTAQALAERGASVHLVCRDGSRGEKVRQQISASAHNDKVELHVCDLSSLTDISRFSAQWNAHRTPIAALVNNAGAMVHRHQMSKDGLEMGFATNTLGTFALTELLRPSLEAATQARVVTVSSGGMLTEKLVVDDLQGEQLVAGRRIDGTTQYSRSKRHQVALTEYWADKYCDSGIFWASMHPGWADTPGLEKSMPEFFQFTRKQLRSEEQGADTIVYLAIADEAVLNKSGEFFFDRKVAPKHLWLSGTKYGREQVVALVEKLEALMKEKGVDAVEASQL